MSTKTAYFSNGLIIELPEWVVDSCPQNGDCTNAIREFLEDNEVKPIIDALNPYDIRSELYEYGAWNDTELANDQENKERILWAAIGNIWDDNNLF